MPLICHFINRRRRLLSPRTCLRKESKARKVTCPTQAIKEHLGEK